MNTYTLRGGVEIDLGGLQARLRSCVQSVESAGTAMDRALRVEGQASVDASPARRSLADVTGDLGRVTGAIREVGSTPLAIDTSAARRAIDDLDVRLGQFMRGPAGAAFGTAAGVVVGGAIGGVVTTATGAIASLGNAVAETTAESLKLAASAESVELAITTMVGSGSAAKSLLADLRAFAVQTPYQFAELSTAAKQLLAMGVNAGDVVKSLRRLGDVASGLNVPITDMAYLFGQIKSQGRAMTEDLNQFAGRGVPIYTELAKILKTNEVGVRELAQAGKIGFAEIDQAFNGMTAAGGKFFEMTKKQSESAAGLFSTLTDAIDTVKTQIGKALIDGTQGKELLTQLTAEVEKLTPLAVQMATLTASAFANALPYVERVLTRLRDAAAAMGLLDLDKMYGNPYDGQKQAVVAVAAANNSAASVEGLQRVQGGIGRGAVQAVKELDRTNPYYRNINGVGDKADALLTSNSATAAQLLTIQQARAAGKAVSDEQFNAAKASVAENLRRLGELQETINKELTNADNLRDAEARQFIPNYQRIAAVVRQSQVDAKKALAELTQATDQRRQAEERQKAEAAAAKATKEASDAAAKNAAGDAKKQADADAKSAAERQKREASDKVKELAASVQRLAEYKFQADAAELRAAGRAFDAELLVFDAGWRKKIEAAKTNEEKLTATAAFEAERRAKIVQEKARLTDKVRVPRSVAAAGEQVRESVDSPSPAATRDTIAEAQRRVREAKGGSSERELARIDLKDLLGKRLTADEGRRRNILAERLGRVAGGVSSGVPTLPQNLPRPTDAIGRALATPPAGPPASGTATVHVHPHITVDEARLVRVVKEAVIPEINRRVDNLRGELEARRLSSLVKSRT